MHDSSRLRVSRDYCCKENCWGNVGCRYYKNCISNPHVMMVNDEMNDITNVVVTCVQKFLVVGEFSEIVCSCNFSKHYS